MSKKSTMLLYLAISTEAAIIFSLNTISKPEVTSTTNPNVPLQTGELVVTRTVNVNTTVVQFVTSIPTSSPSSSVVASSSAIPSSTQTSGLPANVPSPLPLPSDDGDSAVWSLPDNLTNLLPFNITYFPAGLQNVALVTGIPESASATGAAVAAMETGAIPSWDNSSSVLQLLYPANSINPASQPQGGAEFYAQPLELASAQNVSLEYSVFFPADFDWVLGGKLPGMYGGHYTCSGGRSANDCFSTRLMWRRGGVGELYLYAPKDKQTESLCSDSQSGCDTAYGFSIGRGSFTWTAGAWTHVRQVVTLNTPGEPDGAFSLDVNGHRMIDRADVFYRDVPSKTVKKPLPEPSPPPPPPPPSAGGGGSGGDGGGGLLGPILGGLFGSRAVVPNPNLPSEDPRSRRFVGPQQVMELHDEDEDSGPEDDDDQLFIEETIENAFGVALSEGQAQVVEPVGFVGLFFSTFFGGHEQRYATPRDQYIWFKDFSMSSS